MTSCYLPRQVIDVKAIPAFLDACHDELAALDSPAAAARADEANAGSLPRMWLVIRNLLFLELATAFVGWGHLRAFFADTLHPLRFRGLPRVEPEMLGR